MRTPRLLLPQSSPQRISRRLIHHLPAKSSLPPLPPLPPLLPHRAPRKMSSTDPFIWIDCEMTGLSPSTDTILSLCCYITTPHLRLLSPSPYEAYITHPAPRLAAMSPWCLDHHGRSGLIARCTDPARSTTAETAARGLLDYIRDHGVARGKGVMAGNSVHCDREFMRRDEGGWGEVVGYLSYRILDVSSFKEAVKRWGGGEGGVLAGVPVKEGRHEARRDIEESIEEMRYYRRVLFGLGDEEEEEEEDGEEGGKSEDGTVEKGQREGAEEGGGREAVKRWD